MISFLRGREAMPLTKSGEFEMLLQHFKRAFGPGSVVSSIDNRVSHRDLTRGKITQDAALITTQVFALITSGMVEVPEQEVEDSMDRAVAQVAAEVAHMSDIDALMPGAEAAADNTEYSPEEKRAQGKIEKAYREYMSKDFFKIFGVERSDMPDEGKIKDTFFQLAKQWHTDAFAGMRLGSAEAQLEEMFKRITEAYETLTDKSRRGEYMVFVDRQERGLPTDVNQIMLAEQVFDQGTQALRRRDVLGAKTLFKRAVELNAGEAIFLAHLGWVTIQAEPHSQAALADGVNMIKKAVSLNENLPLAYQFLGQICQGRNQSNEARKWFERCLEYDPNNVEAQRGLRLINQRDEKEKAAKSGLLGRFLKK
jgi:tetratricopeptide (TPR) repeat protein